MLRTTTGELAGNTDKIMLLAMWVKELEQKKIPSQDSIITAGIGKPTFPINESTPKSFLLYWGTIFFRAKKARYFLSKTEKKSNLFFEENITKTQAMINYDQPAGNLDAKKKIADSLTSWYGKEVNILPDNILFTTGGAGALYVIFKVFSRHFPNKRIITPFPHYSLHAGADKKNLLFPIHVMRKTGYQLTAEGFEYSLKKANELAKRDHQPVGAFLLCDPNNPLGTTTDTKELVKIASILRKYPDILIILDEAYAEMRFDLRKYTSFLSIAPDLKKRVVLMRSATKAFSAAGERMAVLVAFDTFLMKEFIQENINICGHSPLSGQHAFVEAMHHLDQAELMQMNQFYEKKIKYVEERLCSMGAEMPDPAYKVTGTFYILANLKDLIGLDLPPETKRALGKTGKIKTDEDIAYYLLFVDRIMIAPLSYFGLPPSEGYMRITCSASSTELNILMDRLENRLFSARKLIQSNLQSRLKETLKNILLFNKVLHNALQERFLLVLNDEKNLQNQNSVTAKQLKEQNLILKKILSDAIFFLGNHLPDKKVQAAVAIQSAWRGYFSRKKFKAEEQVIDQKMREFIEKFSKLPHQKKLEFF